MRKIIAASAITGLVLTPVAFADDDDDRSVLHIGDSNTVAMTKEHQGEGKDIESAYEKAGFDSEISAAVSRALEGKVNQGDPAKDEDNGVDGLKRLIDDHDDSTIVMAMGVNDAAGIGSPEDALKRIEKVMDVVDDDNEVLWPLVTVGSEADSAIQKGSNAFNEALEEAEGEHDNLSIIEWEPEEEWFRDGVHYTPEGYEELISTIVKAVEDVNSDSDDDSDDSDDDDKESNKSTKKSARGDDDSDEDDDSDDVDDDMDEDDDEDDEDEDDDIELHSSGSISEESL